MITPAHPDLSLTRQCALLGLRRSSLHYRPANDNSRQPHQALAYRSPDEVFMAAVPVEGLAPSPAQYAA